MKRSAELTIRQLFFKKRFKEKYPCSHKQLIQTLGLGTFLSKGSKEHISQGLHYWNKYNLKLHIAFL